MRKIFMVVLIFIGIAGSSEARGLEVLKQLKENPTEKVFKKAKKVHKYLRNKKAYRAIGAVRNVRKKAIINSSKIGLKFLQNNILKK